MYLTQESDYIQLMGLGRENHAHPGVARVAVLGYCTTQYYAAVLRGLGAASGFPIATYEPEYNTVNQVVLDEESKLYAFDPEFVVVLTAVQAVRDRLLTTPVGERVAAAAREASEIESVVERLAELSGTTTVVNEFVIPYERAWGNFTAHVDGALPNVVAGMNERLRRLTADHPNVFTVDTDHVASWLGKRAWFDERLWFYSKSFCHPEALPTVAGQAVDIFLAVRGKVAKCIAFDLDNTLWGGVIGDDGLEGIRLGELEEGEAFVRFQLWLKGLSERGIILAVCSKNDEERAREPFLRHPDMVLREENISSFVANWEDKAQNLRTVARQLNIGLDSIVFLDDSPFERNLVRELLPEVSVPELPQDPAEYVPYLESLNLFEATQFSDEDRRRTELYRSNALRETEQARFTDVASYLASLEMEARFERFDDLHLPRIAQLVQRTNQFNLTTIRHSASELEQFAADADYFPFYVTLADRFGDNGLISVVIGKREGKDLELVTWLMSCRVIARRLEEFVLDQLVDVAREQGLERLVGRYIPTAKNGLVSQHYETLGFTLFQESPDGSSTWQLSVDHHTASGAPIARTLLV
jgi:FkbH-like protein